MVTGVDVVYAITSDMDRSLALYRDVLGMSATNVSPYWSEFTVGGVRIALHPPMEGATKSSGGWTLCLACEDLKNMRGRVQDAGYTGAESYHETPGGVIWNFVDFDGNRIDLIQPGAKIEQF